MSRSDATVEELFSLLPELEEFDLLRLRLLAGAILDPRREWDSSADYATVDKRLVTRETAERALADAEESARRHVSALFEGLRGLLAQFWDADTPRVVGELLSIGGRLEEQGVMLKARQCYRAALTLALPLPEKGPQLLALRRMGRIMVAVGEFREALLYYERSTELARDTGDLLGEVVGLTGIGNVSFWQGRLAEAETAYQAALARSERIGDADAHRLERGQIYNNLGNLCSRLERRDEAEAWLARAFEVWESTSSPTDQAYALLNLAHLREAQERLAEAVELIRRALALPIRADTRTLLTTDLANAYLRQGKLSEAVRVSREAEDHAIAARSPYTLGYMYQGRGRLALARGEEDGFIFFEKALEIARDRGYPFLEAETLLDYARLRLRNGGREEAQAYLEHAREMFVQLGTVRQQAEAEALLAEIGGTPPVSTPAG